MKHLTAELRAQIRAALDGLCRSRPSDATAPVRELRVAAGDGFEPVLFMSAKAEREALLERLARGELVELEIDFRPYAQVEGLRNRNFVRFRPGLLRRLARSFRGTPLITDHAQHDIDRRAGTVLDSNVEPIDGGYAFAMTARVTAPRAVEAVLRGNFDRFSIGWDYPGLHAIECSIHGAPIFTECDCFPGDVLEDDDGGEQVAEFVFNEADGVEVSAVNVPAVPGTYIEQIRTALSKAPESRGIVTTATFEWKEPEMNLKQIAKALGLPETASEDDIVETARAAGGVVQQLSAQLDQERAQRAEAEARARSVEIDAMFAAHADRFPPECDVAGHRVRSKLEQNLRQVAQADIELARSTLAALPKAGGPPSRLQSVPEHAQPTAPESVDPNAQPAINAILKRQLDALDCTVEDLERFGPQSMPTPRIRFGLQATRQHTARR